MMSMIYYLKTPFYEIPQLFIPIFTNCSPILSLSNPNTVPSRPIPAAHSITEEVCYVLCATAVESKRRILYAMQSAQIPLMGAAMDALFQLTFRTVKLSLEV